MAHGMAKKEGFVTNAGLSIAGNKSAQNAKGKGGHAKGHKPKFNPSRSTAKKQGKVAG
jgi:hypothetical protein